jgi:hypothetical protein
VGHQGRQDRQGHPALWVRRVRVDHLAHQDHRDLVVMCQDRRGLRDFR